MKFSIKRNGDLVCIHLNVFCDSAGTRTFPFSFNCGNDVYAAFLERALGEQFESHIEAIRRNAYNAGWRDKTKRNRKRDYFDYCPNQRGPL